MDVQKILIELRNEREQIEDVIISLGGICGFGSAIAVPPLNSTVKLAGLRRSH